MPFEYPLGRSEEFLHPAGGEAPEDQGGGSEPTDTLSRCVEVGERTRCRLVVCGAAGPPRSLNESQQCWLWWLETRTAGVGLATSSSVPRALIQHMANRLWASVSTKTGIVILLVSLFVAGCSPTEDKTLAAVTSEKLKTPTEQYAALVKNAKGVSIGPMVSDYTVFVMFDPQCLHCARLWEESKGLPETVKFVWVPVNFFDGASKSQSALLLRSTSPREDMDQVMSKVLARTGSAPDEEVVPPYLDAIIKTNTDLINRFHVLAVPYVVARNQTTSEYVARQGGMSREMLKRFLGIGSR